MRLEECDAKRVGGLPGEFERGVGAREPHVRAAAHLDERPGDALAQQVITRIGFESLQCLSASRVPGRIERGFEKAPKDSLIIAACERLGLGIDRAFIEAQRLPPDMQQDISVAVSVYRQFKAHSR